MPNLQCKLPMTPQPSPSYYAYQLVAPLYVSKLKSYSEQKNLSLTLSLFTSLPTAAFTACQLHALDLPAATVAPLRMITGLGTG